MERVSQGAQPEEPTNPYDVLLGVGRALRSIESDERAEAMLKAAPFADSNEGIAYMLAGLIADITSVEDGENETEIKRVAKLFGINERLAREISMWLVVQAIMPPEITGENA